MTAPTKSDLRGLGYRMTANADDLVVARCASEVKEAYLLHHVTEAQITAAASSSEIGEAWAALTFLRFVQDVDFGTRTGGEKKRFEYGEPAYNVEAVKDSAALKLRKLAALYPSDGKVMDICAVWFKTQLFN